MLIETLKILFNRDLKRLKNEIDSYADEKSLWLVAGNIPNSGGNLCLHLIGNLNEYIGAVLGRTGYVRTRPLEFSRKDVPRAELVKEIEATAAMVERVLSALTEEQLIEEYPVLVLEKKTSTEYFLVHLALHLDYHLGQINYHRRFLAV